MALLWGHPVTEPLCPLLLLMPQAYHQPQTNCELIFGALKFSGSSRACRFKLQAAPGWVSRSPAGTRPDQSAGVCLLPLRWSLDVLHKAPFTEAQLFGVLP